MSTNHQDNRYLSFVTGAPAQHDPERWPGLTSVGQLLMDHGRTGGMCLRGKILADFGPRYDRVGAHRADTRTAVSA